MWVWIKFVGKGFGFLLAFIGIAGIPEDTKQWIEWFGTIGKKEMEILEYLNSNVGRWMFTLIGVGLVVATSEVPRKIKEFLTEKTSSEDKVKSVSTLHGADKLSCSGFIETAESIEELRHRHNVSLVSNIESGLPAVEIPNLRFGFVKGSNLATTRHVDEDLQRKFLKENQDRVHFSGSKINSTYLEVHKLGNGELAIIVFANQESILNLKSPVESNAFMLFFDPYMAFNKIVSIPISSISKMYYRLLDDGTSLFDVFLQPNN